MGAPEREVEASEAPHVSMTSRNASQRKPGDFAALSASAGQESSRQTFEYRGGGGSADVAVVQQEGPGLRRVREFILKIKPNEADEPSSPSWQELQLQPTPTLLPDLR